MSKRYYYNCPIKALYMIKEFGIKTYMEAKIICSCNLNTGEITKGGIDIFSFEEYFDDVLHNNLEALNKNDIKIYIAKKSENIFEPKKGDEGRWLRPIGAHYANHNGEQWVSAGIEPNPPEIIMRDNKQFFMPEVEND